MPAKSQFAIRWGLALAVLVGGGAAQSQSLQPPPASPAPLVRLEYDAEGNPTRATQAPNVPGFGFATSHEYDRLQRRSRTTDARDQITQLNYNGSDGLVQVIDPRQLVTHYPRNGLGDVSMLVSPDTGADVLTYDSAGNIHTRLDSRSVLATHQYDALSRRTSTTYTKAGETTQVTRWVYDQTGPGFSNGIGRLTSAMSAGGSATYAYDAHGRLVSTTQAVASSQSTVPLTTGYVYDAAGRIARIMYPSGRVLVITYSGATPTSLSLAPNGSAGALPLVSDLQFEPVPGHYGQARRWLWHLESGTLVNERIFDIWGRMVRYPLGGAVRDLSYDAAGRIASYTHLDARNGAAVASLDQRFSYDELGRLTQFSTAAGGWTIGYDSNGNRTTVTNLSAPSSVRQYTTASDSNRLLSLSNPTRNFSHDAAGNTQSDVQGNLGWIAAHDLSGRMVAIRVGNGTNTITTTQYAYNHLGQRILKRTALVEVCSSVTGTCQQNTSSGGAGRHFVYGQDGSLLGEYSAATGGVLREYVWLDGMPVAVIDGSPTSSRVFYVQADHLNTPRVVLDRAGWQRWHWIAEPFGNSAPVQNPTGLGSFRLDLRMPGQLWDEESGLLYNWHRSYDAGLGRYTQSDPIGLAGGINTYSYVENQPTMKVDPTGELAFLLPFVPAATGWGWGSAAVAAGAILATASIPGDTSSSEKRTVPYPDRKRGKYTCICRANKDGRSPDNCSIDNQDFAMGYGEGPTLADAKRAAEKDAKEKLGARSTHHIQCRCTGPNGDRIIPHG